MTSLSIVVTPVIPAKVGIQSFKRSLEIATDVVFVLRHNGRRLRFTASGGGWQSDPDVFLRLANVNSQWQVTTEEDEIERYDNNGRLISITTREGWVQALSYTSAGYLSQVSDPAGRTLLFDYDTDGRLSTLTDSAGQAIHYEYSSTGMLTSVIYPDATTNNLTDNPRRQYLYEDGINPQALTGLINENGVRFATWAYDSQGRAILSEHAGGVERVTLAYQSDGTTTVTNALAEMAIYEFDQRHAVSRPVFTVRQACASCAPENEVSIYDSSGRPVFRAGANQYVETTYNVRGLVETQTQPPVDGGQPMTTVVWHPIWRLPLSIAENTRTTYLEYDNGGRLIRRTVTDNASGATREWQLAYSNGMPVAVDGPRTDVSDISTRTYDAQFNLLTITNAVGHTTTVTAVDPHGRITGWMDANGIAHQVVYDLRGRVVAVISGSRTTRYDYDAVGNLTRLTLPDQTYVDYAYDAANRLVRVTHPSGDKVEYQYDAMSNKIGEFAKDANGNVQRSFTWLYHLDRLVAFARGGAASTTVDYSFANRLTQVTATDPRGVATLLKYNALNDLVTQHEDLGGVASVSSFDYDVMSNLTGVVDPIGESTVYGYDGLGDRKTQTSLTTGATAWTYDSAGNQKTRRDAQLDTVTTSYDALDRVTGLDYPGTTQDVSFIYDVTPAGCTNGKGRLCRIEEGPLQATFSYDQDGHVTQYTRTDNGVLFTTATSYNTAGRVTGMTYPSGRSLTYERDDNGRLHALRTTVSGVVTDIVTNRLYNTDGQVRSQTLGDSVTETRSYDNAGATMSVTFGALESFAYIYDAVGNIIQQTDGTGTRVFGYDGLNRLISETAGAAATTYEFDANGNRTRRTSAGIAKNYSYVGNALQSILDTGTGQPEAISTDVLGRRSDDQNGARTYDYNARGLLASVSVNASLVAEYSYDYRGLRTRKTLHDPDNSITVVLYHYDLEGHLIAETDAQGNTLREYLWADDQPVAQITGSEVIYFHTDHLYTPRLASNGSGVVVWRWRSDAYGVGIAEEDVDGDAVKTEINLRFPGQYFDSETGLHYNWHRYYDPVIGRYISSDPIGLAGGLNTYAYVLNNPLRWTDPTGLAVGDWWDFPANLERARQIAGEELARRPRSHNDLGDAMRHADWMRRTTQETNSCTAWIAGTGHELEGLLGGQPLDEMLMDLHNNAVGRNAGRNTTPVDPGKLWTLPLNGSPYNPYQGAR